MKLTKEQKIAYLTSKCNCFNNCFECPVNAVVERCISRNFHTETEEDLDYLINIMDSIPVFKPDETQQKPNKNVTDVCKEETKVDLHRNICKHLNGVYERKNHDYGDSFGKGFAEYGMIMPVIRLEDKLNRLKKLIKTERKVNDEAIEDTIADLANYAIMTLIEMNWSGEENDR